MPNQPNLQPVTAEEQDLRARLEKAEESLREILSGESDALFVAGAGGAQLFTLKGADQSYRTLIENMSEGALTLTPAGLILYANRRFAEMLRTPLEKVIGSDIHTWFARESRQVLQTLLRKDAADNRREELALAAADGTQVPVNLSVSHLKLEGMPDSFCMVATDLTQQKHNEAILAADSLARAILEQAADAIVICDETGRILRASKQAQALHGKNPLGELFESAFPLRQSDGAAFFPIGATDTNPRQLVEARLERDGQEFDLLVSVGHLKGSRNELLGSVVTMTDITERKETENRLHTSELRFRQMADNIQDAFFLSDVESGQVLYVNPAYEEIWGRSRESLYAAAQSRMGSVHQDDRTSTDENFQQGMKSGTYEFEYRIVRPDGSIRWILTRGFPVRDDGGKIVRIASVAKDITKQKHSEETLLRFRSAMDTAADGIFFVNRSTMRFVDVNAAACKMLGYTREELLQMGPSQLAEATPEKVERVHDAIIAGHGTNELTETALRRKDGSQLQVELRRHALRSGTEWIIVGVARDITERKLAEESRLQIHAELSEAQRIAHMGSWQLDVATNHVTWSEELYRLMGLNPTLPPPDYTDHAKLFTPESWKRLAPAVSRTQETGAPYELELEMARADGRHAWMLVRGEAVRDASGAIVKLRGVSMDITERKAAENSIRRLNRVYAVMSGINTLIVRVRDREELFRDACRIAVEDGHFKMAWMGIVDRSAMKIVPTAIAGWEPEVLTLIKDQFPLREDAPLGNSMSARAVRERKAIVSNDIRDDTNNFFSKELIERGIASMAILPLLVADEPVGVFGLFAGETGFFDEEEMKLLTELAGDIAFAVDHIDKQARLDYLAYYDVLTGLANRSLFLERVTQYMRSATGGGHKLALFLIDLERFKNINDSLGRPAGDALLKQVAEWLARNIGGASLLARLDADHFAAVMPEVTQDGDVARPLEKIMDAFVDHPFRVDDAVFRIAARVGVAIFPDDGADAETLFRHAEAALKQAKASGERYLFYTQKMTAAVAGKLTLENQLRQALDNDEFVLHYQPKVNLVSGKVTGAEALIRWNDPHTGLVPPGRFIPILEETGLIYDVGRWALKQAIADYLRWRAAGLPAVRIAVNVSPLQLRHRDFIAEIGQTIGIDAHAPAGLELEITESLIMEDIKGTIASLQAIRDMGVRIAIDDFGTGFSSLSYLAKLPVDTLKIDSSFVVEMTAAPEGLALVSTIINLAHSLRLTVVAEGVETEEQSRLLRLLACDEMQGFLFSKPVPIEVFESNFLATTRVKTHGEDADRG